jgi:hypothetical protein
MSGGPPRSLIVTWRVLILTLPISHFYFSDLRLSRLNRLFVIQHAFITFSDGICASLPQKWTNVLTEVQVG